MMSLWDALRMNMMISYQELVRTFLNACTINNNSLLFFESNQLSQFFSVTVMFKHKYTALITGNIFICSNSKLP
ncbi:Uncharacterised protein [Klebsiella pneumoniae]|nr:Uncharacterised protein [Klebsiella pneumoniae]